MADIEERLRWHISDLEIRIRQLERENLELQRQRDDAEHRVRYELEPRIAADERRYDSWATSPERG